LGHLKETDHMENLDTDERIILQRISKILDGRVWTGFIWHAFVNMVMKLEMTLKAGNLISSGTISF